MPTRRGIGMLLGGGLAWAGGRLFGIPELYIIAVAAVALVAAAMAGVGMASGAVAVRRRLSEPRAHARDHLEVLVDLRNDGRLPTGLLLLEDACPVLLRDGAAAGTRPGRFAIAGISPGTTVTRSYPIVAAARGRWNIGPMTLRLRDPFGVAERRRRYRATSELLIYPEVHELAHGPLPAVAHAGGTSERRRLLDSGDEFHTMREYRDGDDLRRVHWASTARRGKLMVRQNEQPWAAQATLLLDTRAAAHHGGGPSSTFEQSVVATASVAAHLSRRGYDVRLTTVGDPHRPVIAPLHTHLERLAEVEPSDKGALRLTLDGLRRGGLDGLLVAIVAAPPGRAPLSADPEARALLQLARSAPKAIALVSDRGDGRGDELVALLRSARWRAAPMSGSVETAWAEVLKSPRRRGVPA